MKSIMDFVLIESERRYIFVNEGSVSGFTVTYNTQLAKANEFKSYWDLFHPKWKGKIVSLDARDPGFGASELRYLYYYPELGAELMDVKPAVKIIDDALAGEARPQ